MNEKKSTYPTKGWSRLPLRVKLISYFLLFAFVMLIFLWLFQMVFLDDFYRHIKTQQIKVSTSAITEHIDDEDLVNRIEDIHRRNDVAVAVFDTSSDIFVRIYSTRTQNDLGLNIMPHEVYTYYDAAKISGKQVLSEEEVIPLQGSYYDTAQEQTKIKELSCAEIAIGEDGTEYLVVLKSQITPVTSTVGTLRIQLLIITAILVVFAIAFAVVVSSNLSKPLAKTNEGAKELARHNYDVSFDGDGCREICELSETLNVAAAELSNVDRLRRELIANISHDLRTPLTMISGYAEVMRDIPGENSAENLQVIIDESQRLSSLVTDLLDLSKLEADTAPMKMERFCITDSIRGIFSRYTKLTAQEGYALDFECDCDVDVCGDEIRLSQVIYNLINNAINYSGQDKTVTVRQRVHGGKVRIEVTDRGQGIDSEDLKFIWDRYYRVDKEHRSAVVGTGLGLSIAKNVLEHHNARFGVISQVGVGSTFWFELEVYSSRSPENFRATSNLPNSTDLIH